MNEEERDSFLHLALLVNVMDVKGAETVDLDVSSKHRQLVDLRLGFAPVEGVLPVSEEALHLGKGCAIVPTGAVELVRKPSELELLAEKFEIGIGDDKSEGLFRGSGHRLRRSSSG